MTANQSEHRLETLGVPRWDGGTLFAPVALPHDGGTPGAGEPMTAATPVLWTPGEWARAIDALPAGGPLPSRCVLVPRETVSHSLRREALAAGLGRALGGTRFVPMAAAAGEVLQAAGLAFEPGEEAIRAARLQAIFRAGIGLRHFSLALLREKPGWDVAFSRTIGDLEASGLRPEDLERGDAAARVRDLATIWRAVEDSAGRSWTMGRIYLEAAGRLRSEPSTWPFPRPVLATVSADATIAAARFVRAIPNVQLAVLAGRPLRWRYLERARRLFGDEVATAVAKATGPRQSAGERDLLGSYLFEPPAVLADPARPRSAGPDGTVDLEEHAGIEEEVEATADWVARQLCAGTALEEIAVLVPTLDPLAGLIAERLARLPWGDARLPVHVGGGLPVTGTAAGARALAVVRGLRAHLDAASLADVLPGLRPAADAERHLSRGGALDLAWSLGIVGGNPARPAGALEWARRAAEREREIEAQLARAGDEDDPDAPGIARRAWELERQLRDLRLIRPALEALVGVARHVVDGASLADLWPTLCDFLARWLLQPGAGARVQVLLDAALGPLVTDAACAAIAGAEALRMIEETLVSLRFPVGRFGEPAVYVGTVREAVGLGFGAVRVIGLGEGHLPAPPHEDPVLPDELRRRIESDDGVLLPTAADRALGALHALDTAVRGAARRVALSAPRVDVDRSQREPSSVMLEAAAALARPDAVTGATGAVVPDTRALHRDAFVPARRAALAFRHATPLGEAAWQDAVAAWRAGVPPHWRESAATDLSRVAAVLALGAAHPMDGWLAAAAGAVPVPGLDAALPISPSALETLLGCPHRFLLERVIGFQEPSAPPALREIGQPAYGGLFHLVAEQFYRRYGEAFCRGEGKLGEWQARLDPIVNSAFETFVQQYPLVGETVREHERERLRQDARELLESDWQAGGSRRFVDVERVFGRPTPVALTLEGRTLHVRGRIDRLDVVDGVVVLRDLKTGRPYPRLGKVADPDPGLDVQLGLYGLVVKTMALDWGLPARIAAAYAYFGRRGSDERDFRDDFDTVLEPAARRWLVLAADLLAERAFPRTPNAADCTYCPFQPVCGDGVYARAAALLTAAEGAVARFGALKGLGGLDGEEKDG